MADKSNQSPWPSREIFTSTLREMGNVDIYREHYEFARAGVDVSYQCEVVHPTEEQMSTTNLRSRR